MTRVGLVTVEPTIGYGEILPGKYSGLPPHCRRSPTHNLHHQRPQNVTREYRTQVPLMLQEMSIPFWEYYKTQKASHDV